MQSEFIVFKMANWVGFLQQTFFKERMFKRKYSHMCTCSLALGDNEVFISQYKIGNRLAL